MNIKRLLPFCFLLSLTTAAFPQGSLTPPGAPAPTMKTLDQVEPRTLIKALPFTTAAGGSYYFTASLTGISGQNGITVAASNVTIDLNGFELIGAGAGTGIFINGGISNVTIRNGTIRNWGSYGINGIGNAGMRVEKIVGRNNSGSGAIVLDQKATVSDCLAESNASLGIYVLDDSIVRNCQAIGTTGSPGVGISAGASCVITNCTAAANADGGIRVSFGCTLTNCTAHGNQSPSTGSAGIFADKGSTLTNCAAFANQCSYGIHVSTSCTLSNCVARENKGKPGLSSGIAADQYSTIIACTASANYNDFFSNSMYGIGISASGDSTIKDCTVTRNQGDGIRVGSHCAVSGCTAMLNGDGNTGIIGDGIHATSTSDRIDSNDAAFNRGYGIHCDSAFFVYVVRNVANDNGGTPGVAATANVLPSGGSPFGPLSTPDSATSPWANFE